MVRMTVERRRGAVAVLVAALAGVVPAAAPSVAAPDAAAPLSGAPSRPPPARLWLGGDVNLGPGAARALAALPALAGGAGAVGVVNLEGAIAARPAAGAGLRLVNPPGAVEALRAAGVRVAGIANNHAGDAGPGGEAATARALRAGGVAPAGGAARVAIVRAGGLRVAVTAHDLRARVPAALAAELRAARASADALVATFHVTAAPSYLPGPALKEAVSLALAAGASVVAVHGSHLVGPVERRGPAVIAWGLGNVAFACDCTRETEGLLLSVELSVEIGRDGDGAAAIAAGAAAVVPIRAGIGGEPVAPAPDAAAIFDLLAALGSSPLRRAGGRADF
jgi:poly-gamma-glutamate synthesis protein (capsule biosynthesis protein)